MTEPQQRRIVLCADDYGFAPGINRAIRELTEAKRLSATSVMVVGSAIDRSEANALLESCKDHPSFQIGLHATLTAPLSPVTLHFRPLNGGTFLSLGKMLQQSMLRQLDIEIVSAEIFAQIAAFTDLFGRTPAYVDGHQHVQLFPQIRDAFIEAVAAHAPDAWVRQCGRVTPLSSRLKTPKALLLDILSAEFRRRCKRNGIRTNPGFAGAYDMIRGGDFALLMSDFIDGLPDGGVVMCHPGYVDETLRAIDPVTTQREREYAFLAGSDFPTLLNAQRITLA